MAERLTKNSNDKIRNKAISVIRNLTTENGLSSEVLGVLKSFLLIERTENNKLAHYEDLAEQGRLIELPCAVGDAVYGAEEKPIIPLHVDCVGFYLESSSGGDWERLSNIGKTVFLTHEEAEVKLKERGEQE